MAALDLVIDDDSVELLNKQKTIKPERGKPGPHKKRKATFCGWFWHKPWSKLPFIYFLIGVLGVPALVVFHFMDEDTSYLLLGFYIGLNVFAVKYFYTLIGLKQQVDDFSVLNMQFGNERNKLAGEVNRMAQATSHLQESHDRIQRANAKNRENLRQFGGVQETMKSMNLHTSEELTAFVEKASAVSTNWQSQLVEHERDLLHTVFDRYEMASGKDGMTRSEFTDFSKQLPTSYQQRFARLGTFRKIAKDGDLLKFSDFDVALDLFAEMEALDTDIDFTIKHEVDDFDVDDFDVGPRTKRNSTLRVEPILDMDFEFDDPDNVPAMKKWRTTRKLYAETPMKVVVNSIHLRGMKAKDFAFSLGIVEELDDSEDDTDQIGAWNIESRDSVSRDANTEKRALLG